MKNLFLLLSLLLFTFCNLHAQEILEPISSKSYGLNHHTNRDEAYFSHIDSYKNTLLIGTTERDSTYSDILTTKLDVDLNLVWQKRFSVKTNLTYDIPVKSFLTTSNELIIIGRSSFNQSNSNGLIFILKYDENGNLIYEKTIGNIDGSDYTDYGYLDANINNDGSLNLVYSKFDKETYTSNIFDFLKIDENGNIISTFSKEIINISLIGIIKNETYYFLLQKEKENTYFFNYEFVKIANGEIQSSFEISDAIFEEYFKNIIISQQVKLTIDNDENLYLSNFNSSDNDTKDMINLSKINTKDNEIVYSINTSDSGEYFFIDSFINSQQENIVVANNLVSNNLEFIKVVDNDIQIQAKHTEILGTGFKKNKDGSFFITTSNSNIRLFSNDFTEIKSFNTSGTFGLIDFSKINEESISVVGTTYDKMFPDSDFYTQLDIVSEKLNDSQVLNNYRFTGEGTSGSFQERIIIDNDNNYLVFVTEKLGPEYLGIGGVNPPLNQRVIKYDSNLNKIWEVDAPENIYNIITQGGKIIEYYFDDNNNLFLNFSGQGDSYGLGYHLYKLTPDGKFEFEFETYVYNKFHVSESSIFLAKDYFLYEDSSLLRILDKVNGNITKEIDVAHEEFLDIFTIGNDYYFYTYENITNNTPDFISLYKNGEKIFTRELDNNYGIFPYEIDEEGTVYFATDYATDKRMNRLDVNNNYSYYSLDDDVRNFKRFNNGKLFVYLENGNTLILDTNLKYITDGDYIDAWNTYFISWDNYILFGTNFDSSVRIIDQNGKVNKHFKIKGILHDWYSNIDKQGNLLTVGSFGNKIYTYNEYSWSRGFINNYGVLENPQGELDEDNDGVKNYSDLCLNTLTGEYVNEYGCATSQLDDDQDGVTNNLDICPNTPEGNIVNSSGCILLEFDNFKIQTISETCPNSNNAKLIIEANTPYNYQFEFFNQTYSFTSKIEFQYVIPGTYEICIEEPNVTNKQCYKLEFLAANKISGKINIDQKNAIIEIEKGTPPFNVFLNGNDVLTTSTNILNIAVEPGDFIEVKSSKDCEGLLSKTVGSLSNISAYPNPTNGVFDISLPSDIKDVQIELFNSNSNLIFKKSFEVVNGRINIDISNKNEGVYFIKIKTNSNQHTFKILKI
tara:strand:+ start:612 stop:3998 length:3387 start_codon:yes stop_codon:yes gene_type:complete